MMETVELPAAQAADIVERTLGSDPGLTVDRSRGGDGSVEITVSRMGYRAWQIVVAVILFPIGLLALTVGKSPKPKGTLIVTPLSDRAASLSGDTGNPAMDDTLLSALRTARPVPASPASAAQVAPPRPKEISWLDRELVPFLGELRVLGVKPAIIDEFERISREHRDTAEAIGLAQVRGIVQADGELEGMQLMMYQSTLVAHLAVLVQMSTGVLPDYSHLLS